jgi:hypothetical protein
MSQIPTPRSAFSGWIAGVPAVAPWLVLGLDAHNVLLEQWDKAVGQHRYPVPHPTAAAHDNSAPLNLDVPVFPSGQALTRQR